MNQCCLFSSLLLKANVNSYLAFLTHMPVCHLHIEDYQKISKFLNDSY